MEIPINLLDSITVASIPDNLLSTELSTSASSEPIIEKYIRLNNHLIPLKRKAIPPKVRIRESTPVFRWRIPRLDCRHLPVEYDNCCVIINKALDKLEDHINGDISKSEFVDAWQKAKEVCPGLD